MVVIYTENINNRLKYTCNIIFHIVLRVPFQITNDKQTFENTRAIKILYGNTKSDNATTIPAIGLMKEDNIHDQSNRLVTGKWEDIPMFFSHPGGDIPFDLFSAVFYLVTRYEEYLPHEKDEYSRFKTSNSIQFKLEATRLPLVDLWCIELARKLGVKSPLMENLHKNSRFLLTFDVDNAWMYKHYRPDSTIRKIIRPLVYGKFKEWLLILCVLLRLKKDPAYVFKYLRQIESRLNEPIQYFILNGNGWGYDKSPFILDPKYRRLIRRLNKHKKIGIHPSFMSNVSFQKLQKEYRQLTKIVKEKIEFSRQHFLMLTFPETYNNLIKLGISVDFSMGFSNAIGFRAGIARPYPFFNLETNTTMPLTIVPFMVMDVSLNRYLKLNPENAAKQLLELMKTTKNVGGRFVALWHNTSLSEQAPWNGWKYVFEKMIDYTLQNENS